MKQSALTHDNLENIEAEAWLDMYAAAPPDYVRENALRSCRIGGGICLAHGQLLSAKFTRTVGAASLNEIDEAIAWIEVASAPGWVVQVPVQDETASIRKNLEARGYAPRGNGWAKFARNGVDQPRMFDPCLSVRAIAAADARVFAQTAQAGFGLPATSQGWLAALAGRRNWHLFLAYWNAIPIACGAMFTSGDRAWMGIDTTLPAFRNRGAQSMLIAARLGHGDRSGVKTFTAETGQPQADLEHQHVSFSNYRRAGFINAYTRLNYARAA